jgi:hypothetical protein
MMNRPTPRRTRQTGPNRWRKPRVWLALLAGTLFCSGCAANAGQQYIPSQEAGQRTLETALTAWQNGATPLSLIEEGPPGIRLVDTHHKPEQKLSAFTVLGPTTGDVHRCYAVRLVLDNPREEVRARFMVMGLDPLWVVRYEDFEMFAHWDCAMPATTPKQKL